MVASCSWMSPARVYVFVCSPQFQADHIAFASFVDGRLGRPRGLFCTLDGGFTWEGVEGLAGRTVTALALSPAYSEDGTVFAATSEEGVFKSVDGGVTWCVMAPGFRGSAAVRCLGLSASYDRDETVYGATSAGLCLSRDGGRTWALADWPRRAPWRARPAAAGQAGGGRRW